MPEKLPEWLQPDQPEAEPLPEWLQPDKPVQSAVPPLPDWLKMEPVYKSPYASRGLDVAKNLGEDINDFGKAGAGLWALANLRVRENMLDAARALAPDPFVKNELTQAGAQPGLVRPTDPGDLWKAATGIVDYYNNEYAQPFLKNPAGFLGYLGEHFRKAPLATALDIPIMPPAARAVGRAGQAVSKIPQVKLFGEAAKQAIAPMADKLPQAIQTSQALPRWMKEYSQGGTVDIKVREAITNRENARIMASSQAKRETEAALAGMSEEQRQIATVVAERSDPGVYAEYIKDPQFAKAVARAREVSEWSGDKMHLNVMKEGTTATVTQRQAALPEFLNLLNSVRRTRLAELGAEYRATTDAAVKAGLKQQMKSLTGKVTAGEVSNTPHLSKLLDRVANITMDEGQEAAHLPIISPKAVARTEQKTFTEFLGGGEKVAASGKAPTEMSKQELRGKGAGHLVEREEATATKQNIAGRAVMGVRQAGRHEMDIGKLINQNAYNALRFEAVEKLAEDIAKLGELKNPPAAWAKNGSVDLARILSTAAEQAGAKDSPVLNWLKRQENKGTVWLPPPLAKHVNQALAKMSAPDIVDMTNSLYTQGLFALDPTFGPRLALQTANIQATSLRHPRDFINMLVAHVIALDPASQHVLADALLLSHGTQLDVSLLQSGVTFKKLLAQKSKLDYDLHNFQRRAAALDYILFRASKAPPDLRATISMALNTSAALEKAASGTATMEQVKGLQNFMKGHYGDYSKLARMNRATLNKFFPVSAWIAHAGQMVKTIPFEYPFKVAITGVFGKVAAKEFGVNEKGQAPVKLESGKQAKGPGRRPMWYTGLKMDTVESGAELVQMAASVVFDTGKKFHIPSGITPLPAALWEWQTDVDQTTQKPFKEENPDILRKPGTQRFMNMKTRQIIKPDDRVGPPLPLLMLERLFPKQMSEIQRLSSGEYAPSRYTYPGHPAPRAYQGLKQKESRVEHIMRLLGMGAFEGPPAEKR